MEMNDFSLMSNALFVIEDKCYFLVSLNCWHFEVGIGIDKMTRTSLFLIKCRHNLKGYRYSVIHCKDFYVLLIFDKTVKEEVVSYYWEIIAVYAIWYRKTLKQ